MDRKLRNSLAALSATGLLLAFALFAAMPLDPAGAAPAPLADARGTGTGAGAADALDEAGDEGRVRRSTRGAQRGLALPYFSFARGLRRIGG